MAGALLTGLALHFLVENPDRVTVIPVGDWQLASQATAAALALTPAPGTLVGGWDWRPGLAADSQTRRVSELVYRCPVRTGRCSLRARILEGVLDGAAVHEDFVPGVLFRVVVGKAHELEEGTGRVGG